MDAMNKRQAIEKAEKIYKEISEDDKRLAEDFLSIYAALEKRIILNAVTVMRKFE